MEEEMFSDVEIEAEEEEEEEKYSDVEIDAEEEEEEEAEEEATPGRRGVVIEIEEAEEKEEGHVASSDGVSPAAAMASCQQPWRFASSDSVPNPKGRGQMRQALFPTGFRRRCWRNIGAAAVAPPGGRRDRHVCPRIREALPVVSRPARFRIRLARVRIQPARCRICVYVYMC